jgi:O-succinylbenzoate synthase
MVRAVRGAFPACVFHVDCNSAYRLKDQRIFEELDGYGLAMIEQPLASDDLLDHAKLQRKIQTPICLDESIVSPEKASKAINIGAARWFNIKPGRVGGLTPALQVIQIAERAGIPCWVGGMLESGLGASHCLALATLSNIKYPSDVFPSSRFFEKDLACPELTLSGPSQMRAAEDAGIGCSPDEELLASRSVQRCQIRNL